ncbi:MAG: hypothetical protein EBV94_07130 [Actinobacteria bacterium]|jgi:hypothetical protein|nr:hypothetical protein [Actinomycetota bacterium]NCW43875.1 hypothetical protein [Actinomycetota bacterium]
MANQVTILEEIIGDVAIALYQKWYNAMPVDERSELAEEALKKNAQESALFVIQMFMDKFNQAAEELKNQD